MEIKKVFEQRSLQIKIKGVKWSELTNVLIEIKPDTKFNSVVAPSREDINERDFWLAKVDYAFFIFEKDIHSRQACFTSTFGFLHDTKCISLIHFFIRDKKLCLNVYQRSCNFTTNYHYDADTFIILRTELLNKLKTKYKNVKAGDINWHIFSLHKLIK
jgi:hypothetical protein